MNKEVMKTRWKADALAYMHELKIFDFTILSECADAVQLAESLWDNSENDLFDHAMWIDPKEAVDEELTYWCD